MTLRVEVPLPMDVRLLIQQNRDKELAKVGGDLACFSSMLQNSERSSVLAAQGQTDGEDRKCVEIDVKPLVPPTSLSTTHSFTEQSEDFSAPQFTPPDSPSGSAEEPMCIAKSTEGNSNKLPLISPQNKILTKQSGSTSSLTGVQKQKEPLFMGQLHKSSTDKNVRIPIYKSNISSGANDSTFFKKFLEIGSEPKTKMATEPSKTNHSLGFLFYLYAN